MAIISKDVDIKNWTYYFFNDIINIKNFDLTETEIDEKSYKNILLDPQPWQEGSYKTGSACLSFCPSFCLSVSFLGIHSLVFSET